VAGPATSLSPLDAVRGGADGGEVGGIASGWRLALRDFVTNRRAVVGVGILLFFLVFCYIAPHIYFFDWPNPSLVNANAAPGAGHPLGADGNGFDLLGELMIGGQASLEVGLLAAFVGLVIGSLLGAVSGMFGGIVDAIIMRLVDIFLSLPFLLVVLILAVRYGASIVTMSLVIALFTWPVPARLVRGEVLTLRERDFVHAATVAGANRWRLIGRHLLPNAMGVVIVNGTFQVADAILTIASVGYIGFGLRYPTIDWGDMLSGGVSNLQNGYWWQIYPVGACIVLTVMAFNFIGDAMRDAVDVGLRRR
jgi:peptide/nickel transport system permease protein